MNSYSNYACNHSINFHANNFKNETSVGHLSMELLISVCSKSVIILVCKILSILLTACLNGYLILIFGYFFEKKTFSNLMFLSIAFSDFIIGTLSMTSQLLLDKLIEWPFDKVSCLFSIYLTYAIPDTTILALLILTAHRYFLLNSPFKVNESLTKFNLLKLFCPWIIATSFWIVSLSFFMRSGELSLQKCDIMPSVTFKLIKVTAFGFIPLLIIIAINVILIVGLKKKTKKFLIKRKAIRRKFGKPVDLVQEQGFIQRKNRPSSLNLKNLQYLKLMKKDRRAAICIFALTMSIFLTQIVYLISWPLFHTKYIYKVGVWLSYLTSLTNPVLVYVFHEKVKCQIRKKRIICF